MRFDDVLLMAANQPSSWTPYSLGAKLILWWDAEDASSISLAGSSVTAWTDKSAAFAASQATGTSQPTLSATAVNNRPGVVFDGTDDFLTNAGTPSKVPAGNPREWWFLGTQTRDSASAITGRVFRQGATNATTVQMFRASSNGLISAIGNGTTQVTATIASGFSGTVITRQQIAATDATVTLNGGTSATASVTPSLSNELFYMATVAGASAFHQGAINTLIQTEPLTEAEAAQMLAYLKFRGGVA